MSSRAIEVEGTMKTLPTGETMGKLPEDSEGPADVPDFIEVFGNSGHIGYVRKTDFAPALPSSPAEALARQAQRGDQDVTIPVYAEDGKTVIDTFTMQD